MPRAHVVHLASYKQIRELTSLQGIQIDHRQRYLLLEGLYFPYWEPPDALPADMLIVGELVIDIGGERRATSRWKITYNASLIFGWQKSSTVLAFDCLVVDGLSDMNKPLIARYTVRI